MSAAFRKEGMDQERIDLIEQLPKKVHAILACSWARLALSILPKQHPDKHRPLTTIETVERYVVGNVTKEEVINSRSAVNDCDISYVSCAAYAACDAAVADTVRGSSERTDHSCCFVSYAGMPWETIYKLYFHAKGPSYPFKQEWKTSDVTALVNGIVQDRAFDRMPILADALQDAGLTDAIVLTHLQHDQCFLSDWVIWNVMGWDK